MSGQRHRLFRIIVPADPKRNAYTSATDRMTALGPLCIATIASKLSNWDAELIDKNNCGSRFCPKAPDGYPDHRALQAVRPAAVVGFYGSMSSSVPRLYQLAKAYKEHGATAVAGGKQIEFLPEEALANGIDIAVLGEGEETIREILLDREAALGDGPESGGLERIAGIAYLRDGQAAAQYGLGLSPLLRFRLAALRTDQGLSHQPNPRLRYGLRILHGQGKDEDGQPPVAGGAGDLY